MQGWKLAKLRVPATAEQVAARLQARGMTVEAVQPDYVVRIASQLFPNDPFFNTTYQFRLNPPPGSPGPGPVESVVTSWGQRRIGMLEAWTQFRGEVSAGRRGEQLRRLLAKYLLLAQRCKQCKRNRCALCMPCIPLLALTDGKLQAQGTDQASDKQWLLQ